MNATLDAGVLPAMQELHVSNDILDDRTALLGAWDRDGYWFFRDVLDTEAVGRLRRVFLDELSQLGVIAPDDPAARYNGKSLEDFPFRMESLASRKTWKPFVAEPPIHRFFSRLLADEPFWIPTVEYRATPPAQDRARARFDYVHQDGFYNAGIPFSICWIPLVEIDPEVGGLVLAEGMHKGSYLHDLAQPPLFPIPDGAVPAHAWRRTTYRPGDVVIMHLNTPHTGVANYSDRFRLSMDIRVMAASGDTPIIGNITSLTSREVAVQGGHGRSGTFAFDEYTYCRGIDGRKVPLDEIPSHFHEGDEVILAARDGRVTVLRPPH
ncbi:phytanoyl-CoA dioxygenase PhyH [Paraburkholderia sp. BL6669N2]|uniref:phytanoyl-CoA dioxygenase family protein n=1 Tax=Paraburkholderia sp. BL6669N2 TaxID=1938807 RepID=UPI000E280B83|nr:phytanoyl-CoA dioxygenase family protein [Paraburkholderia sp. BL6669N2]REG58418.1 phytanoyl-CoA dioxygenase PhyH [Paraburkholderia sp. BL6669N2]